MSFTSSSFSYFFLLSFFLFFLATSFITIPVALFSFLDTDACRWLKQSLGFCGSTKGLFKVAKIGDSWNPWANFCRLYPPPLRLTAITSSVLQPLIIADTISLTSSSFESFSPDLPIKTETLPPAFPFSPRLNQLCIIVDDVTTGHIYDAHAPPG